MKQYSEDDIVRLSDKLIELLTYYRFDKVMLNTVGHLLEITVYYINTYGWWRIGRSN